MCHPLSMLISPVLILHAILFLLYLEMPSSRIVALNTNKLCLKPFPLISLGQLPFILLIHTISSL